MIVFLTGFLTGLLVAGGGVCLWVSKIRKPASRKTHEGETSVARSAIQGGKIMGKMTKVTQIGFSIFKINWR